MTLVLAIAFQAAPTAAPPSIAGWTISHEAARCTIQRDVIIDSGRMTVALQAIPLGSAYRLLAFYPSADDAPARAGRITVRQGASSQTENDMSMPVTDPRGRLVRAGLPRDLFTISDGAPLIFEPDREPAFSLSATDVESGLAMLGNCETHIASEWGIDPTQMGQVVTPAEPAATPGEPIAGSSPFPASGRPIKSGNGTVITLLTIKKNGRVDDCKVVQTSGNKALDRVTCRIFRDKVRYQPARNSMGQPIRSWKTEVTDWALSS